MGITGHHRRNLAHAVLMLLQHLLAKWPVGIIMAALRRTIARAKPFRQRLCRLIGQRLRFLQTPGGPTPRKEITAPAPRPKLRKIHAATMKRSAKAGKAFLSTSPCIGAQDSRKFPLH